MDIARSKLSHNLVQTTVQIEHKDVRLLCSKTLTGVNARHENIKRQLKKRPFHWNVKTVYCYISAVPDGTMETQSMSQCWIYEGATYTSAF